MSWFLFSFASPDHVKFPVLKNFMVRVGSDFREGSFDVLTALHASHDHY